MAKTGRVGSSISDCCYFCGMSQRPQLPENLAELLDAGDIAGFRATAFEDFPDAIESDDGRLIAFGGRWIADLTHERVYPIGDWLNTYARESDAMQFGVTPRDYSADFWARPQMLFHGTSEESVESIVREGINPRARTRGVCNRGIGPAVFASTDEDMAESYGKAVVRIDTRRMKADGIVPPVAREPDVEEGEWKEALARRLGDEEYYFYIEQGISPETVIFRQPIPPQFLSVTGKEMDAARSRKEPSEADTTLGYRMSAPCISSGGPALAKEGPGFP